MSRSTPEFDGVELLEAPVLAVLLNAAGDPIAVSRTTRILHAAWTERADALVAADQPTFQAWVDAVEELGRYETLNVVAAVREQIDELVLRRPG